MNEAIDIAIKLCKQFEGCAIKAYWDKWGDCWTIGYGYTGPEINSNTVWTMARAESELRERVNKAYDAALRISPGLKNESAGRQAAITDFIYNLGAGTYEHSPLRAYVDLGQWDSVKAHILPDILYTKANGKTLPGLVSRRAAEEELL